MKNIIETLNWRYAVKKYDASKKISAENIATLEESIRLTPSSFGLQPLTYLWIENEELRLKLKEKGWGQSQFSDASHILVLCTYNEFTDEIVDDYMQLISNTRGVEVDKIAGFGNHIKNHLKNRTDLENFTWGQKQAYISLGQMMLSAALLEIDATPMEGFEPEAFDEILGLKEKNLRSVLVCAFGYRSEEDGNQHIAKVRKSKEDLFERI